VSVLLEVQGLERHYPVRRGLFRRRAGLLRALAGVSFAIEEGETLALVGESGSGKSTLARTLLRLEPASAGRVLYARSPGAPPVDLLALRARELFPLRRELQIVFQDPYASLNPRLSIGEALAEPLRVHGRARGAALERAVLELLERVGLPPEARTRYPHEFSGGQRQRIAIARALAPGPRFLVFDEALSALDVSVQAQIVNLLLDLRAERSLTYLFIAHDLGLVRSLAERIAVLYLGRIVEIGRAAEVLESPSHPYTRALLAAAPASPAEEAARGAAGEGEARVLDAPRPSAIDPPGGCPYRLRCPLAEPHCAKLRPELAVLSPTHAAACHLVP
jgi:oligopeptide/dipeptide ABC transporter ATP-binding protein